MEKGFKKTEIQICGDCKGEGKVWQQTEPARHGSDTGSGAWKKCTTCMGEGRVIVTRVITITIEPHKQRLNQDLQD